VHWIDLAEETENWANLLMDPSTSKKNTRNFPTKCGTVSFSRRTPLLRVRYSRLVDRGGGGGGTKKNDKGKQRGR